MFRFLITGLLLASVCHGEELDLDGEADIYDSAIRALGELRATELADEDDIYNYPGTIQRASSVCYDELGCFDKNGTFKHLKQLPEPPETVDTKFLLFTRKNLEEPQIIDYNNPDTVLNSNINPKVPFKFIVHGFGGKKNRTWIWSMKSAFLEKEDLNVIVIDWVLGAKVPFYIQSAVNTELVGAQAAVLFFFIKDRMGVQEKDLHVIGFSLGAHVAGFVGKRMKLMRGTRPGRITGLDPASPLFEEYGGDVHLSTDDADYVDVVHTNADYLMYGGLGIRKSIGHVDFFPNGGRTQPGCGSTIKGIFKDMIKNERRKVCNHERAAYLFTDSILNNSPCEFTSYKCSNYSAFEVGECMSCEEQCGRMGYYSHGSGTHYLMTKKDKPYCAGLSKLTVKFASTVKKSYGAIIVIFVSKSGKKQNVTLTEKDEKLIPGDEKVQAMPISDVIGDLDHIQVLYKRFNGWVTKGAATYGISSVTITNPEQKFIYKSCNNPPVILKDNEYFTFKETVTGC